MATPSTPRSPRSPPPTIPADPVPSTSTKSRRTVRLPPQLHDDSSDEELSKGIDGLNLDGDLSNTSRNGPSHDVSPQSRISSIVGASLQTSIPKVSRSLTSNSLPTSARNASSSAAAAPPAAVPGRFDNSLREWKSKYTRASSSRSSVSSNTKGKGRDEAPGMRNKDITDPDAHFYHAAGRLHHLDDEMASDEEDDDLHRPGEGRRSSLDRDGRSALPMIAPTAIKPGSSEEQERLQWQSMLNAVLAGDVLQGESSRIGEERTGDETFRQEYGRSLWWQLRAKLRGRSEDEEKRRVEERRGRAVDGVLEEIASFVIKRSPGPAGVGRRLSSEDEKDDREDEHEAPPELPDEEVLNQELSALDQVNYMLQKLSLVEGLYPHTAAFRAIKPLYDSEAIQARVDALTSWSTVVYLLQAQLSVLQKWTGSDDLDVTKPNTTKEKALVGKNRYHAMDNKAKAQAQAALEAADDSTFLERIMKEDNLQRTFEKRVFVDLHTLVHNARQTVISHISLFEDLKLPDFQYELVRLIGFPSHLVMEALKVRLDAAGKLVDPSPIAINDMIDSFRLTISLAVLIKRQYEEIVEPDADGHWKIPPCMPTEYDTVLLDGLRTFFKLLHWKLKGSSRTIYFRETEVLEDEWEFLYEAAEAVPGGDLVVAEHFCSLTNKLMVRVCNYFDSQLHIPIPSSSTTGNANDPLALMRGSKVSGRDRRRMTTEEMLVWYGKILDAVRMRYRKLQRFARRLSQRFDNSAEYAIQTEQIEDLVDVLVESGHFLVYTQSFEEKGTYVIADGTLWNDPYAIRQLLERAFSVTVPSLHNSSARRGSDPAPAIDENVPENGPTDAAVQILDENEDLAGYLLLLSPTDSFTWTGPVMKIDLDYIEFALDDNRVRLIADGPSTRLLLCKRLFSDSLLDPETAEPLVTLECVVEAQAHLPRIQKELRKIARSNYRLTESFIESATHVQKALAGAPGTQDMTESWYQFASEHGRRALNHVEVAAHSRFTRLLMRLAISWCSFICDNCDYEDRKTFRWTVTALRTTLWVTEGSNILNLDLKEFSLLKRSVASLIRLLIMHFDILGARGSIEAKKEAERIEGMRRLQRQQENIDDDFIPRTPSPSAVGIAKYPIDRSIRVVQDERLARIAELEDRRLGVTNDQHLVGQVLDEQVSEDRALVFLAASSSNIALRWQQGAFIGGGANGNVYIGFNLDSGGVMAVKEIRVQDLSNSPALYKQIKDESDVMSMLSHPNIVEYFGIEVHRDRVFIFQEYCEGGSLANQLEHGRIEDEEVVTLYAIQMLNGLQYLHSKGVEHRDVKPENILLGSSAIIKFVDFGAAKVIAKGNRTMAKTRAMKTRAAGPGDGPAVMNSLAGTPMYMAPEVIRASEKAGALGASDIWSMGCVLLEISTGRKPWSNLDNEWAIMFHIGIATQAPPLPEHGELSELGIEFIESCLTLDPPSRPTAEQLLTHPWLENTIRLYTEQAMGMDTYNGGSNSNTTTLVDSNEAYAAQLASMTHADSVTPSEELGSFEGTPEASTPMEGGVLALDS